MIPHLDYLLKDGRKKKLDTFDKKNKSRAELIHQDAEKNLKNILKVFEEKNMEAVYVETTTPEVAELGFKVVKVIVPECQSPYWGGEQVKSLGGRRLYEVPKLLGFRTDEPKEEDFNLIPHPFA